MILLKREGETIFKNLTVAIKNKICYGSSQTVVLTSLLGDSGSIRIVCQWYISTLFPGVKY